MNRRTKITLGIALIVLQGVALLVFFGVSERRERARGPGGAGGVRHLRPPDPEALAIERFEITMEDGTTRDLARLEEPTIVHFWATWCPPCKRELPALIAWSNERPIPILIISLDPGEVDLSAWTGEARPETLARAAPGKINEVFHASTLPVTFLIEPGGRITARAKGARAWEEETVRAAWTSLLR